jgi:hypothetical protein
MQWQPIETAPKDGTIIIAIETKGERVGVSLVSWYESPSKVTKGWVQSIGVEIKDGKRIFPNKHHLVAFPVTYWMPLPEMPK